jgi:hypothetical protein
VSVNVVLSEVMRTVWLKQSSDKVESVRTEEEVAEHYDCGLGKRNGGSQRCSRTSKVITRIRRCAEL